MSAADEDAPGLSQQANEAETEDDLQRPLALTEKTSESPPFGLVSELLDLVEANRTKKMKPTEKGRYKQDLIARFMQVRACQQCVRLNDVDSTRRGTWSIRTTATRSDGISCLW